MDVATIQGIQLAKPLDPIGSGLVDVVLAPDLSTYISAKFLFRDPQQLPATIFNVSGKTTKYDRSLFQRLEERGHDVHLLDVQYRMDPVISSFPRRIFYGGLLQDGPNVKHPEYGGALSLAIKFKFPHFQPLTILDLESKEDRTGTSVSNRKEAQLVLQLYRTIDQEIDGLLAKTAKG